MCKSEFDFFELNVLMRRLARLVEMVSTRSNHCTIDRPVWMKLIAWKVKTIANKVVCELIPSKIKIIEYNSPIAVCGVRTLFRRAHAFLWTKMMYDFVDCFSFHSFFGSRLRRLCSPHRLHTFLLLFLLLLLLLLLLLFCSLFRLWLRLLASDQRIFTFPINSGDVKLRPEILCAYRTSRTSRSSVFVCCVCVRVSVWLPLRIICAEKSTLTHTQCHWMFVFIQWCIQIPSIVYCHRVFFIFIYFCIAHADIHPLDIEIEPKREHIWFVRVCVCVPCKECHLKFQWRTQ